MSDRDRDMRDVLREIESRFGLGKTTVFNLRADSLILQRSDTKATLSIIPSTKHEGYSAQIEVPDENVPLLGLDIPFVDDCLSYAKMLSVAGSFIEDS